jgi:hypothetical protein
MKGGGHVNRTPLFAGLSWAWYGEFDGLRLEKFGLPHLFENPHLGSIPGLNGLSALVVALPGKYNASDVPVINASKAKDVLKAIGRTAPEFAPFSARDFSTDILGLDPPGEVWEECYKLLKSEPEVLVGALWAGIISAHTLRRGNVSQVHTVTIIAGHAQR